MLAHDALAPQGQPLRAAENMRTAPVADIGATALRRKRVWLTLTLRNEGLDAATVGSSFELRQDGAVIYGEASPPVVLAAGKIDSVRLSVWTDVRSDRFVAFAHTNPPQARVVIEDVRLTCSKDVYQGGEPSPRDELLQEAMQLYARNALRPLADPVAAWQFARVLATGAEQSDDIASAMRSMLGTYGDGHSYFYAPHGIANFFAGLAPVDPTVTLRSDGVAVIVVPGGGASQNVEETWAYAERIESLVMKVAHRRPRGWVVDLRGDGGGDMWPTLSGLSSLIGYGVAGGFQGRARLDSWNIGPGRAVLGSSGVATPVPLTPPFSGPVAVLIGPGTMSAGEMVAVAFHGRPRTRLFGAPTAGTTNTGIERHLLSDGSLFGIAQYHVMDRRGQVFDGAVQPDVVVGSDAETLAAAVDWIRQTSKTR